MDFAAPERLLSLLVDAPAGVNVRTSTPLDPAQMQAARRVLIERGHRIEELDTTWRLQCATRHFSPARFCDSRQTRFGAPLEIWERVSSTNDLARRGADAGAPEGAVWLAEEQVAGRGRQGRQWNCAAHTGLLFSLLLRPDLSFEKRPLLLPLALGLGVCEGIRSISGADVRLKWPNDLLLEERKLAGILVETRAAPTSFMVVGAGVNVDPAGSELARQGLTHATTLAASVSRTVRREDLLAAILLAIEHWLDEWRAGGWSRILASWMQYDVLSGRQVQIQTGTGLHAGRVLGLADNGCLRLQLEDGKPRDFAAGEVHLF